MGLFCKKNLKNLQTKNLLKINVPPVKVNNYN